MRQVPKFFNTAGPIQPDIHYNIDPLTRIDLEELESLIYQRKYFVLHAPRQTGKTSCLLALRDYLNTRGEFYAVYANVEVGQASRNNVEEVNRNMVSVIARETSRVVGTGMPSALRLELKIKRGDLDKTIAKGLEQTVWYMDRCGDVSGGHFIVFNRDKGVSWDEKIWHRREEYGGWTITVWGM